MHVANYHVDIYNESRVGLYTRVRIGDTIVQVETLVVRQYPRPYCL